jgi:hypothetical protein
MLIAALAARAGCYFPFQPPVVEVTTDTWVGEVSQEVAAHGVVVALFIKKRSPPCKALFPDFQEAANRSHGMAKFVSIDAAAHPKLAFLQTVRAVPAFRLIHRGGAREYRGDSSPDSLLDAAYRLIPNLAEPANASWAPSAGAPLAAVLLTTKQAVPAFWARVSCVYYAEPIAIGYSMVPQLFQAFGVTGPTSIVFVYRETLAVYDGQLSFARVSAAIARFAEDPQAWSAETALVGRIAEYAQFEQLCHNTGRFCVFAADPADDGEFEALAKQNSKGPFRFFRCGESCPYAGMTAGFYVFHGKRATAVAVAALADLPGVLDRVIDGGAAWVKIGDLFPREDL